MADRQLAPILHYLRKVTSPAAGGDIPDAELLARFALSRDEIAFTALVRRHGPMVLAVCRRIVRDGHAAEDAFQATFLVLARKAGSLAKPELLAHWLYGVAYRTATKAKTEAARRRAHEQQAVNRQEFETANECEWRDLRAVLDEEVNRLPQRYRVPVVLCYLQGQTNAEAARRLGCSRGTVATLLARARDKLRRRLTQRGVGLSIGFGLAALTPLVRGGAVPLALEQGTVKAATLIAAGRIQAVAAVAAPAVALAKGVSEGMLMQKLKIPAAILLITAVVGGGAGISIYRAAADQPEVQASDAKTKPRSASPKPPSADEIQRHAFEAQKFHDIAQTIRPAPASGESLPTGFTQQLPDGPAPIQVLVRLDEQGRLSVAQKLIYYQPETETFTLKNGQKTRVTYYDAKHFYRATAYDLPSVRIHDTKGRGVDESELRKRLRKEILALISADGRPVDPKHLQLYKENTLVFVLPPQPVQPAAPPPAPAIAPHYAPAPPAGTSVVPMYPVPAASTAAPPPVVGDPGVLVPPSRP